MPRSSSSSSSSPSPRRRKSKAGKKGKGKGKRTGAARKRTHWMVLVKAIYAVKGTKGAGGLTEAMKEGPALLPAFKSHFSSVPSEEAAIAWVRTKL